ncbi:MAG TPA: N-formylglutamate amidohydrolase [Thermohalobaculum sp.]|nr:N-formylglutamate amidohydrolase [Thermohalobaculum sp.]
MTGDAATAGPEAETVAVENPAAGGDFVIVCEHASNAVPPGFDGLGLDAGALASHIAWDPGALAVARRMALVLDAPLVAQRVSRLVYDCNRPPDAASAIPEVSEVYRVPGNTGLSIAARAGRAARFYAPFRDALAGCLDARLAGGRRPVLLTVHSFTPVYDGVRRDTGLGILHDRDRRFADALLDVVTGDAARREGLVVHRNRPYGPRDGVTHTLAAQALPRGLLNAMIEIRNDLVADASSQRAMGDWLAGCARAALARLGHRAGGRAIA